MRNLKTVISVVTFLMAGFTPIAQALDKEKLLGSFFSIVMIRGYNPDGSLAYGSGVIVAQNKVLTIAIFLDKPKNLGFHAVKIALPSLLSKPIVITTYA